MSRRFPGAPSGLRDHTRPDRYSHPQRSEVVRQIRVGYNAYGGPLHSRVAERARLRHESAGQVYLNVIQGSSYRPVPGVQMGVSTQCALRNIPTYTVVYCSESLHTGWFI